jgi:hypothetical protein
MTTGVFLRTVQAKIGQIDCDVARRATAAVFHGTREADQEGAGGHDERKALCGAWG